MIVKIARYFPYPDIKRQTPSCSFQWKDITFTEEDVEACDYLVILDSPKKDFKVKVNRNNILHFSLEPPNEVSMYRQYGNSQTAIIYNQFDTKKNNVLSHGALPWHVDKDYDFLSDLKPDTLSKDNNIVWVTSNQRSSVGHINRMDFLESIRPLEFVKLYGRGINPIDDKWEVLSKSKYAIAYENYQNDYNWTEKITDCFLSYTMPLYFGCNRIENFFPKNSLIQLDPKDKHVSLYLKEISNSSKWEEGLEAIAEARNLALNEYQLFPFIYSQIKAIEAATGRYASQHKEWVHFTGGDKYFDNYPNSVYIKKQAAKLKRKIIAKISKS
ncbi:glycosyltransferase family 10 domain-containing protein [Flavobacterium pallidum]|uniref:Fucosyltransferase C-terminal domain-containing protein n=1 Tax=Flavobacterium pallidum TaxID=2172098 RepID=A0A2S1SGZ4_9FLAO|nr:glycosyltransferase family 10 [Flavobacterium pallidum]AWI25673.1 hypothetical protein HYN49_07040 [Flavobacterium pallidum]